MKCAAFPVGHDDRSGPMSARLSRRLDYPDAVVIGVAAMVGAGVFAAFGPAAAAAGPWLLVGLVLASLVAYANAMSTAALAARMPTSGGNYSFAGQMISPLWGWIAGWAFLVGKTASCAAMALTFGTYVYAPLARPLAVAVLIAVTLVNHYGIAKTAFATRAALAFVLLSLTVVVVSGFTAGADRATNPGRPFEVLGVMESAGILFFAFAGYARLATLGEEVKNPERTIPRAVRLALAITLAIYVLVALAGLWAIGWQGLATSQAPLQAVVQAGPFAVVSGLVTAGAAVATAGVLLSLTAGMGRTAFAMARQGDLPHQLSQVSQRHQVPQLAGLTVGVVVIVLVLFADLRGAIAVSSFAVLAYYAVGHAAAWRLDGSGGRLRRLIAVCGCVGCVLLAFTLPLTSVAIALGFLGLGVLLFGLRHRLSPP